MNDAQVYPDHRDPVLRADGTPLSVGGLRGRGLPREFVAHSQRTRLVEALVQVVAARGYENAGVAEICQAAGVSKKTFYELFGDKEGAFLAAFDLGAQLLMGTVSSAFADTDDWPEAMRAGLRALLNLLAAEPEFARICIVDVTRVGDRGRERWAGLLEGFVHFFAGAGTPGFGDPDGMLVRALVDGIAGRIHAYVADGRAEELPDLLPPITYLALLPFLSHEQAAAAAASAAEQRR